jgi:hypothetical protein
MTFHNGLPKGGRPKGARNRLCRAVLDDLMADWREGGPAAIKIMRTERPHEYVRAMVSILPKELILESSMTDLTDDQLDELIDQIKQQLLTVRREPPMLIEAKSQEVEPIDAQ